MMTPPAVVPGQRIVVLDEGGLRDILAGRLVAVLDIGQTWTLALIAESSSDVTGLALADQMAGEGCDVIKLSRGKLLGLTYSRSTQQHWVGLSVAVSSGARYFVTVVGVDREDNFDDDGD